MTIIFFVKLAINIVNSSVLSRTETVVNLFAALWQSLAFSSWNKTASAKISIEATAESRRLMHSNETTSKTAVVFRS